MENAEEPVTRATQKKKRVKVVTPESVFDVFDLVNKNYAHYPDMGVHENSLLALEEISRVFCRLISGRIVRFHVENDVKTVTLKIAELSVDSVVQLPETYRKKARKAVKKYAKSVKG